MLSGTAILNLFHNTIPTVGVMIAQSDGTINIAEGGATDTYSLVLDSQPIAYVTIAIANSPYLRKPYPIEATD